MVKRTCINPESFATNFATSMMSGKSFNEKTVVEDSKNYLVSFLTAYYLAQDFNKAESQNFENASQGKEKHFKDMTFEELLTKVGELNKY